MSQPRPGDRRIGRRRLRRFRHALRGAAAWSVRPAFDPERVRDLWAARGLTA